MSGLRARRELVGMSQTELARQMTAKGFNWSQMTVSRREENENTLRWNEGIALRGIVGYPEVPSDWLIDSLLHAHAEAYRRIAALVGESEREGAHWVASNQHDQKIRVSSDGDATG